MNEVIINNEKYIKASEVEKLTQEPKKDDMEYCIIRTYSAGVFAGYIEKRDGKEVVIRDARRLWYWNGASSLSQLAVDGVKYPDKCKFPCTVDKITVTEAIEILQVTDKAKKSIEGVKVWEM